MTPDYYLVLAAILFTIGATGVLIRRNAIVLFMCIELMLNAVNLTFVALSRQWGIEGQLFFQKHLDRYKMAGVVQLDPAIFPGHPAMLYEMGIPVVETAERWSVDIGQKVPLSFDRDNVPPAYLARVRALTLEAMQEAMTTEDANATWARDALRAHGHELTDQAVHRLADLRFGQKRVAYDPSDPEANSRAVAAGFAVVHGGQLSRDEWAAVRRTGAIMPAGQVTPSPKPYSEGGKPLTLVDPGKYTPQIAAVVAYVHRIAHLLVPELKSLQVDIANQATWPFAATYGPGRLVLNLGRLGHGFFAGPITPINDLLLHEFGHHYAADHLSLDYHNAITALGARMTSLALEQPGLFVLKRQDPIT